MPMKRAKSWQAISGNAMANITNGTVNSLGSRPLTAAIRTATETERTMAARYPPRS